MYLNDPSGQLSGQVYCCNNNLLPQSFGQLNGVTRDCLGEPDAYSYAWPNRYTLEEFITGGYLMVDSSTTSWGGNHPLDLLLSYLSSSDEGTIPVPPNIVSINMGGNAAIPKYQYFYPGLSSFCGNILNTLNVPITNSQAPSVLDIFNQAYQSMFNLNDCDISVPTYMPNTQSSIQNGYWMPIYPANPTQNDPGQYTNNNESPQYNLQCGFCGLSAKGSASSPSGVCTDSTTNNIPWSWPLGSFKYIHVPPSLQS